MYGTRKAEKKTNLLKILQQVGEQIPEQDIEQMTAKQLQWKIQEMRRKYQL